MSAQPANKTPQIDLLYRDIKIQLDELQEIRPYKACLEEIISFLECQYDSPEFHEIERIILKHGMQKAPGEQPGA